ncbi:alpha/beta hydrolase [Aurantiacibacter poecillastricola]|uniref:alpha/beta hydrolase n=1 Tax=Aurantiacibacter poecillastricola TaxID=3064385 RepID=UPI00273ECB6F|nr:alpha/beta hydrolase fold domain-containing protein [Aurantiacibacter sp. 219JJ12-13]MDP5263043.1 alpha/beta hydrolase fold domain-containing protein [Aurantiacibacter sp. 219JJ12-13]
MVFRKAFLPALAAACLVLAPSAPALAQQHTLDLYDGPAPGSQDWSEPLVVHPTEGGEDRYNTTQPRLQVFLPEPDKADGAAIVMLPGGGLRVLGMGADMHDTIAMLNDEGIAVIVLEYRTLQRTPEEIAEATAPRPPRSGPIVFPSMEIRNANANPSPDDPVLGEVLRLAVGDGQAALRLVRSRAAQWRIDPERVGMFGTSAGGGVAFGAMMADEEGATPDFIVSNFGPALQDIAVPQDAPPLFLITEAWHGPVTDGLIALFQMWIAQREPAELHVYDVPNFTMTPDLWGPRLIDWMKERELLGRTPE